MTPIEIACRHTQPDGWNCGAEAGEPCAEVVDGRHVWTNLPNAHFHAERIEDAAGISNGSGTAPTVEQFDKAVEGLGIL